MSAPDTCTLRPVASRDLAALLQWRNDPDVRRYMLSSQEIGMDEHHAWFERASADPSRRLMVAEAHAEPFGFVQFSGVVPGGVADWGFYVAPRAPKGSGNKLGRAALYFAFEELKLHKVCGEALGFNTASIRFHERLGFRQEGVLREQHRTDGRYHDLICFGLLRAEWLEARSNEEQQA